jgi:hypothetical protein
VAKQSGLGDNFYIGGYNISGDVGSLGNISGGPALREMTGIDKLAMERDTLQRSGQIEFSAFFNDAALAEHPALSTLPTTDRIATYCRGTTLGNQAACLTAKQINYDPTRTADGNLTETVQTQSNSYGLEWGRLLTAGVQSDTTATNGASIDTTASLSFGAQAYLQVFSFTGTSVTITIQDSANDSTWANITGLSAFTVVSSAPTAERITSTNTTTIRRYLRVITAGTFSECSFAVVINKNETAGVTF